ncbi:MAG: PD-(D/E)XK nuclease family protein, partial [Planctomycetia bacterium]|nr:PD-(D/E)XK nuclease family protein [Planctomycetia bacterium]
EIESGESEVPYGRGWKLRLNVARPGRAKHHGAKRGGPRGVFAGGRVVAQALVPGGKAPKGFAELLRRLESPPPAWGGASAWADAISVTALMDFEKCPMLFRVRYELDLRELPPAEGLFAPSGEGMTAADEGTVLHRVFEAVVSDPGADVGAAVGSAIRSTGTELPGRRLGEFVDFARDRVRAFAATDLGSRICEAKSIATEVPFAMRLAEAVVSGVIDLAFERSDGEIEIVDYKSNRVSAGEAEVGQYDIQLGVYALALGRHLGRPVTRASIYFLRPAVAVEAPTEEAALKVIEDRAGGLINRIASGHREPGPSCPDYCPCRSFCGQPRE